MPELLPVGGVSMTTSVRSLSELLSEGLSCLALRLDPLVLAGTIVCVASSVTRKNMVIPLQIAVHAKELASAMVGLR